MVKIIGIYVLLWSPYFILSVLTVAISGTNETIKTIQDFALVLGTYNSSINIFVYSLFNKNLRRAFVMIYKKRTAVGNQEGIQNQMFMLFGIHLWANFENFHKN